MRRSSSPRSSRLPSRGTLGRFVAGDPTERAVEKAMRNDGGATRVAQRRAGRSDEDIKSRAAIERLVKLNRERLATLRRRIEENMSEGKRTDELRALLRAHQASLRTLLGKPRPFQTRRIAPATENPRAGMTAIAGPPRAVKRRHRRRIVPAPAGAGLVDGRCQRRTDLELDLPGAAPLKGALPKRVLDGFHDEVAFLPSVEFDGDGRDYQAAMENENVSQHGVGSNEAECKNVACTQAGRTVAARPAARASVPRACRQLGEARAAARRVAALKLMASLS